MMERINILIIVVVIGFAFLLVSQTSRAAFEPVAYQHPDMERVAVEKDIIYKSEDETELKLDIYFSPQEQKITETQTVILIHGIAPLSNLKDTELYQSWGKVIAASGLTAVTFNWRTSDPDDIADLIQFVRENAEELKINKDRISVIAYSLGVEQGVREVVAVDNGFISSIIVYYGKIDQSILETESELPPMFIAMGALDSLIPVDANEEFIDKARTKGSEIILAVHPYGRHGFETFNHPETVKIIKKSINFIKEN